MGWKREKFVVFDTRDEARVQRTMRFTSVIDRKLRELAEARGVDLNAAVCVAVAEDWQRTLSDHER